MLRAILFDFNGVIVDDEPLHFLLFQKTLAQKKIKLTQEDYYEKYLGYDDYDCFKMVLKDQKISPEEDLIRELIKTKGNLYLQELTKKDLFVPGVIEFIRQVSEKYFLGIVSGALRQEIEVWLKRGKIYPLFQTVVAAEDITDGKPNPEGYYKAVSLINRDSVPSSEMILPPECLVIEDSKWGIEAAHAAGMKCLALATSYPRTAFKDADWVVESYAEINLSEIEKDFEK